MKLFRMSWVASAIAVLALGSSVQAGIAGGNLAVVRVGGTSTGGAGSAALTNAATAVFIDEFQTTGSYVDSIGLPTTVSGSNGRLTMSGTATSEGSLNLSTNGQYLTLGGYNAAVGTTTVAALASAVANRTVGVVDISSDAVDTTTLLTDAFSGNNFRSVASTDGSALWLGGTGSSGTTAGPRYTTKGSSTSTQISNSPTNVRVVQIFNDQLYESTQSGAFRGINTVGTGLPTVSGSTTSLLSGFDPATNSPASPYAFVFANASTLYVADERSAASGGGVQKWTLSGGTWSLQYTLAAGTAGAGGTRGLTADLSGPNAVLYATTTENSANRIVKITDTGSGSAFTTIATAAANTVFRGLQFIPVPTAVVPEPSTIALAAFGLVGAGLAAARRRQRTV